MRQHKYQSAERKIRSHSSSTSVHRIKRVASQEIKRQRIKKQYHRHIQSQHIHTHKLGDHFIVHPHTTAIIRHRQQHQARFHAIKTMHKVVKEKREQWASIAEETQRIVLGDGKYVEERHYSNPPVISSAVTQFYDKGLPTHPFASGDSSSNVATNIHRVEHDIFMEIQLCRQGTIFYPHFSQSLAQWASTTPRTFSQGHSTKIEFLRCSTLRAAQHYSLPQPSSFPPTPSARVGVLSSASPKRPGGGFLHGGDEQEERIVRLSTLLSSLTSPLAKSFYDEHRTSNSEDGGSGLHDHAILFSPGVVVFRSEPEEEARSQDQIGGRFFGTEERYSVDIVSVSPVNAAAVRQKFTILPEEKDIFEEGMKGAMKERMARALRVFEDQGNKTLILGAFGSGSCENRVEDVAEIWAELLVCGDRGSEEVSGKGRFKDVFDRIVFAVPGKHFEKFKKAFEMRIFEAEVEEAASSESDDE